MAIGTSGSGRQTLTEINVTPLVDVMLVLLIIFMVTAPLIQQGVEVNLPEARAEPVKAEEEKLVLSVKADRASGSARPTSRPGSSSTSSRTSSRPTRGSRSDKEVYLMADKNLPYGFVVEVMAVLQRAGVTTSG